MIVKLFSKALQHLTKKSPDMTAETATAKKSIVDPKYRNKDKTPDWVADLINAGAAKDGGPVDVDALFTIAVKNSLDVAKFESQGGNPGFTGRFRMSLSNMLRAAARKRHGLYNKGGTWVAAPADWLAGQGVEGDPTHKKNGQKIEKPKAEKAAA